VDDAAHAGSAHVELHAASPPLRSLDTSSSRHAECAVSASPVDSDGDGVVDGCDVCPDTADPGQLDVDGDGRGWACDALEELPFHWTDGARAAHGSRAFAVATSHDVLTVSARGALVTGRLDGTDPRVLYAEGGEQRIAISGSSVIFTGIEETAGSAGLYVDERAVMRPSTDLGSDWSTNLAAIATGALFVASSAHGEWAFGVARVGRAPIVLGRTPARICGGAPPMIVRDDRVDLVVGDALVPFSHPNAAVVSWPLTSCSHLYCVREEGTLRVYRIGDDGRSTLALDTHHPTAPGCESIAQMSHGLPRDFAVTTHGDPIDGSIRATVVVLEEGVERGWVARDGFVPRVRVGDTSVFVEWSGRSGKVYEHLDRATGAATELATMLPGAIMRVEGDRIAVLGSTTVGAPTTLVLADGPRVVLRAELPDPVVGSLGLAIGSDVAIVRRGERVEAWAPGAVEPLVLATDAMSLEATSHFDSVLFDVRSPAGVVTSAVRALEGRLIRTDLPEIHGHRPLDAGAPLESAIRNWIHVDDGASHLVRIGRGVAGDLAIAEVLTGTLDDWGREGDDVLAVADHGDQVALARLGPTLEILWRGRDARIVGIGPEHSYAALDHGAKRSLCRVRGPSAPECWSLGDWPLPRSASTTWPADVDDAAYAGVSVRDDGRTAAIRTVGESIALSDL
jgi:hypothetical protein